LALVCDGMGGMRAGAECAATAAASFIMSAIRLRAFPIATCLELAAKEASDSVYRIHAGEGGSTLSALAIDTEGHYAIANVGDSRVYLIEGKKLQQLSKDDTLQGQFSESDSEELDNPMASHLIQ